MQLDPSIPESHLAHSNVLVYQKWDFQGAEMEIKRALDLNPNLVEGRLSLAHFLMCLGRFNESVVECHRALELDPLSTSTQGCGTAGAILSGSRRYDEAIPVLKNEMELDPNSSFDPSQFGYGTRHEGNDWGRNIGDQISDRALRGESCELGK